MKIVSWALNKYICFPGLLWVRVTAPIGKRETTICTNNGIGVSLTGSPVVLFGIEPTGKGRRMYKYYNWALAALLMHADTLSK